MIKQKLITAVVGGAMLTFSAFVVDAPDDQSPTLFAYQQKCSNALASFIAQIPALDGGRYAVTLGEAHRPVSVARDYAQRGIGIANSLHTLRLAIDLNLSVDGVYTADSKSYKPLADLWLQVGKQMGVEPAAGYYFKKQDGMHFSCAWNGVK